MPNEFLDHFLHLPILYFTQVRTAIDSELQIVEPGDAVYIPPNARQFIRNCGEESREHPNLARRRKKGKIIREVSSRIMGAIRMLSIAEKIMTVRKYG